MFNSFIYLFSGGNKRKVSCAIAFIGRPKVVILDEVFLFYFYLYYLNLINVKLIFLLLL